MDATAIFALLIAMAGGGGALTAWITGRTTRKIEGAKNQSAEIGSLMNDAFEMIRTLQAENARKDIQLAAKDKRIEELENRGSGRAKPK